MRIKGAPHSATFPYELARRLIRLYSFVNDTILDPFAGSGTVLKVAEKLKRKAIGYELYEYYRQIIESSNE